MRKESRLSFRISASLSERIDRAINKAEGQIRDRSEFGTKAIQFYLDFIENANSMNELITKSILALADHVDLQTKEISEIERLSKTKLSIPKTMIQAKTMEDHPLFEQTIELVEALDSDEQKELSYQLRNAGFDDIERLYKKYSRLVPR